MHFLLCGRVNEGIEPDIEVRATAADHISGHDRAVTAGDWGGQTGFPEEIINVSVTDSKHKFVELTLKIRCPLALTAWGHLL